MKVSCSAYENRLRCSRVPHVWVRGNKSTFKEKYEP